MIMFQTDTAAENGFARRIPILPAKPVTRNPIASPRAAMKHDRHMIKDSNPSAGFIQSALAREFMACETAVRSLAASVKRFVGC